MTENPRERYESLRQIGMLTTIPFLLLASPLVGFGLGKLLDRWLHTRFFAWIFLGLGAVAGIREVIRVVRKAGARDEPESRP